MSILSHTFKENDVCSVCGHSKTFIRAFGYECIKPFSSEKEEKVHRCLTIAKWILPKAPTDVIEDQANDLMSIPDKIIYNMARRINKYKKHGCRMNAPQQK